MHLIAPPFPLVVQVGFAGERRLGRGIWSDPDIQDQLAKALQVRLAKLKVELQLKEQHFLCGISQLAVGGDILFSRACQLSHNVPQRIFLPEHWEDYLSAGGTSGPDFLKPEQDAARAMFESPHVIQDRVVTISSERRDRFDDVNLELMRVSDVLVCLVQDPDPEVGWEKLPPGKSGGTLAMLERANRRGLPVLELRVCLKDDQLVWREQWHDLDKFRLPLWPGELPYTPPFPDLAVASLPSAADYCTKLKTLSSELANGWRRFFTYLALWIIAFHVLATVCAVIGVAWHPKWLVPLLGVELVFLIVGLWFHETLHYFHAARAWAKARLVAEMARSALARGELHAFHDSLFVLPFPGSVFPILRTINVLQLQSTRANRSQDWKPLRDRYLSTRLIGKNRQVEYFDGRVKKARRWAFMARWTFRILSGFAFLAAFVKLLLLTTDRIHLQESSRLSWEAFLGTLAIMLPILAVAALSLAAAHDVEARERTYQDMLKFLNRQVGNLQEALSEREFAKLMMETESRLLGETVTWYSRRAHTGV